MATLLQQPLTRMVILGQQTYKVVLSPESVRISLKGHHRATTVPWSALLSLGETEATRANDGADDVDRSAAAEVSAAHAAQELGAALKALGRAQTALVRAGALPAEVLLKVKTDPVHGTAKQDENWFIEPMLTAAEVASILRIPPKLVGSLGLKRVNVAGMPRYKQADVRRYILDNEMKW